MHPTFTLHPNWKQTTKDFTEWYLDIPTTTSNITIKAFDGDYYLYARVNTPEYTRIVRVNSRDEIERLAKLLADDIAERELTDEEYITISTQLTSNDKRGLTRLCDNNNHRAEQNYVHNGYGEQQHFNIDVKIQVHGAVPEDIDEIDAITGDENEASTVGYTFNWEVQTSHPDGLATEKTCSDTIDNPLNGFLKDDGFLSESDNPISESEYYRSFAAYQALGNALSDIQERVNEYGNVTVGTITIVPRDDYITPTDSDKNHKEITFKEWTEECINSFNINLSYDDIKLGVTKNSRHDDIKIDMDKTDNNTDKKLENMTLETLKTEYIQNQVTSNDT